MAKNIPSNQTNPAAEFDAYQLEHVPLFEAMYGKNLISLGSTAAIDNMFSGLNINGLKALDIGFGLGGVAFYLAEKYQMQIAGVEIYPWMVQHAKDHTPEILIHAVEFNTYTTTGEVPYESETFDLVYSKGVFNHIADKQPLFDQLNHVLKSAGLLVIADWIFPSAGNNCSAPLVCETKASYEEILLKTGFTDIHFRDDSKLFLNYTKTLLEKLIKQQAFITEKYGKNTFDMIWKEHTELINKIDQQLKFATRITARKKS